MAKVTITTEQYKENLTKAHGEDFELVGGYVDSNTKVRVRHKVCGGIEESLPTPYLKRQNGCKKCAKKIGKKTDGKFKEEVSRLYGDEYTFIDKYVHPRTSIRVRHNVCGDIYLDTPHDFLNGSVCAKCNPKSNSVITKTQINKQKYHDDFVKWVADTYKDDYTVLGYFQGVDVPIVLKHTPCGNTVTPRPSNLRTSGKGCKHCGRKLASKNKMLTNDEFVRRVYEQVGDEYTFNEPYKRYNAKHSLTHNECGLTYQVTPNQFLDHERRCPNCQSSKGEQKIKKYLDDRGFKYKREMTFDDLKYVNNLRFDYGVYKDGELLTLIEFDGLHHVKPVEKWGGEETLKLTQTRDALKNQYAKDNNIPLLRIPYAKRKHINAILDDWFRQLA